MGEVLLLRREPVCGWMGCSAQAKYQVVQAGTGGAFTVYACEDHQVQMQSVMRGPSETFRLRRSGGGEP